MRCSFEVRQTYVDSSCFLLSSLKCCCFYRSVVWCHGRLSCIVLSGRDGNRAFRNHLSPFTKSK